MRLLHLTVLAISVSACRPRQDAAAPSGSPDAVQLRFDAAKMKGASCTLSIVSETGPAEAPIRSTTDFDLAFGHADAELTMQMRSVSSSLVVGPATVRTRVTPELIEEPSDNWQHVVRKAADDADARRQIDGLLVAPHYFLRMDELGAILDYRQDLATDVKIPELDGLALAWALGMPALPVESASDGDMWLAGRFLPQAELDPARVVEVAYHLTSVRDGVATIVIRSRNESSSQADGVTITGSVVIDGEARMRVSDGRPLETKVEVQLDFESSEGSGGWTWRYAGKCAP